jgi:beta-glucanase (GH16 family)
MRERIGPGLLVPALLLAAGVVGSCGSGSTATSAASPTPTAAASVDASGTPSAAPSPTPGGSMSTPRPASFVPVPSGWALAWSDEFDGAAGTPPGAAKWGYDLGDGSSRGNPGWGNSEMESYTDSPANAALDGNSNLAITVRQGDGSPTCYYGPCLFTSARLVTRNLFETRYGRIEARIRVPAGVGLWPAFWMLGNDIASVGWPAAGEIDVMEFVGQNPTEVLGTIHGPGYSGNSGLTKTLLMDAPVADAFHTFTVEWSPDRIAWSVDGRQYEERTAAEVAPNKWVFDHPFFLLLNVAVGGTLGGLVPPSTTFPQTMLVDYVRVYQRAP